MARDLVFVYGSLLSGLHNHRLLAGAEFRGAGRTEDAGWTMLDLGAFPGVVPDGGRGPAARPGEAAREGVRGEVYNVDAATLAALDRLEGHPHFYRRERVRVLRPGAGHVTAWMYVYQHRSPGTPPVPGKDWRAYHAAKQRRRDDARATAGLGKGGEADGP